MTPLEAVPDRARLLMAAFRIVEALPPLVDSAMTRGRGRAKMTPEACAAEIVAGLESGRSEIFVGKSKLLRAILRTSPALGRKILRNG
jgi:uncharacterized oxidoreductase